LYTEGYANGTGSSFISISISILTLPFTHLNRKDQRKVDKLQAMIPYHEGRNNKEEVEKIKQQVANIWQKTREAAFAL